MGARYFLEVKCTKCGFFDDDVYYAPTCGFCSWKCPECKHVVDLEEYSGISYDDASSLDEMEELVEEYEKTTS